MRFQNLIPVSCVLLVATVLAEEKVIVIQAEQLASTLRCRSDNMTPTVTLVEDEAAWRRAFSRMGGSWFSRPKLPVIDFAVNRVVLVDLGQKPTAGYGIMLDNPPALLRNDVMEVRVVTTSPDPDNRNQAQMRTHPCIAVRVPRGRYDRIVVRDRNGTEIGRPSRDEARPAEATIIAAGITCPATDATVRTVEEEIGWIQAYADITGDRRPLSAAPTVDFTAHRVVLIDWGRKPTAGYRIDLDPRGAEIRDNQLQLRIVFIEPAPDAVQAQALTRPCLAVRVPKHGYERLIVRDRKGNIVGRELAFP